MLPEDVLLNIFRLYLYSSPQFWLTFTHVSRRWRNIVFTSPLGLDLRLYCTYGTPVSKSLDFWSALPIVVEYGGPPALDPPISKDEDNIVAASQHSGRVSSIGLTISSPLLEKLFATEMPFSELEELVLRSLYRVQLTPPSTPWWGARLRTLPSTRIAFPTLLTLLSPSTSLVDLQLLEIPDVGYFSPETFADALSEMTQLETLSIHFLSFPSRRNPLGLPPQSGECIVLPALTCLKYRGTSKYLDSFVARIDAPRLEHIDLSFLCRPTMDTSQLGRFINRIESQRSHCRGEILSSEHSISVLFTKPDAPTRLELQVSCKDLARQLSYMAEICNGLSAFLVGMEHLRICVTQPLSWWDDEERHGWWMLIQLFRGTKWVHVSGDQSTNIVLALNLPQYEAVLPALHKLCVREPEPHYAPLQEAAVSLIHSRRLEGHIIGVEYERVTVNEIGGTGITFVQCQFASHTQLLGVGPSSPQISIEVLPEDVLLNIFRLYLYSSPQFWPALTHVSRRWRNIVFTSPLGLDLRLYCTYGTPVSKTLDYWPALPIVVQYGGAALDPPAPEEEDNIVAALKYSDRVNSIDLTISSPLLEKLFAIEMPYSELKELVIRSLDNVHLTLPSTLRWGTRLRRLHLTRVTFPAFPQLLSPSIGLVDLQLHEIPNAGYFSPEAFADALSEMTQLETLSIHFLSFPSRRIHLGLPLQSGERVVLPALTCLKYRGTSKYLDSFVARIDAPRLGDIDITFFNQPTIDASQLGRFIDRIETTSLSQAEIQFSELAISISFTQPSGPTRFELRIPCEQLDWQLSSIAQICDHFSPFIFRIEDLRIKAIQPSNGQGVIDHEQWLKLIHSFRGVKDFYVDEKLVLDILFDLGLVNGQHPTVFPSLRLLRVLEFEPKHGSFTISRLLESRRLQVYEQGLGRSCKICFAEFTDQQELKKHLVVMHAYRLVCPYCDDFEFTPRYSDTFREHLASKHANVLHTDTLILNSALQSSTPSSSGQATRNNDLRASVNFGAFTMFKAPKVAWPDSPTDFQTQLNSVVHFLTSPYPTWLS